MQTLCANCGWLRIVTSGTGSKFMLCRLSQQDPRYPKYPPQPVLRCAGFRDKAADESGDAGTTQR